MLFLILSAKGERRVNSDRLIESGMMEIKESTLVNYKSVYVDSSAALKIL